MSATSSPSVGSKRSISNSTPNGIYSSEKDDLKSPVEGELSNAKLAKLSEDASASSSSIESANSDKKKFKVVFVLGGPGSGKGTNCARIVQDFGYVHLSAGDLLREERKSGSETAKMIEEICLAGKIVPSEITVGLLMQAMEKSTQATGSNKFLIDGFPRDAGNQKLFEDVMSKDCDLQFVLFLDCPDEEMVQRLLKRGQTSGRSDDNIDSIRKRLQTSREISMPIVENYRALGLTREFNSNRDEEAVYADIRKCFEQANK